MSKKSIRTHTFNGHRFDVRFYDPGEIDGLCDSPIGQGPTLRVFADLNTRKGLETVIHESLHAEGWAKTEQVVERTAQEIASLLWRLGYRKT